MSRPLRAVVLLWGLGCAAEHKPAWEAPLLPPAGPAAGSSDTDYRQLTAQADAAWAERADKDKLMRAIFAWESAARLQPGDWQTWTRLSRAAYLYADGFLNPAVVPEADKTKYLQAHEKGVQYGELALLHASPEFAARVQAGAKVEDAVAALGAEAVGAMYWYAANLSRWAAAKGFSTRVAQRDRIITIMRRCLELNPDYFYAAPHREFGALFATPTGLIGADLERARQHFNAALARAPNYLGTHVLYADSYATRKGDRELYRRELDLVVTAPDNLLPELVPEQRLEKLKARRLLEQLHDRF